jgi:P27 family predicted phage terminase small subunit
MKLSPEAKTWLDNLTETAEDFGPADLDLLAQMAALRDVMHEAQLLIADEGVVITGNRGAIVPNPAIKAFNDSSARFAALAKQLGMSDEQAAVDKRRAVNRAYKGS